MADEHDHFGFREGVLLKDPSPGPPCIGNKLFEEGEFRGHISALQDILDVEHQIPAILILAIEQCGEEVQFLLRFYEGVYNTQGMVTPKIDNIHGVDTQLLV